MKLVSFLPQFIHPYLKKIQERPLLNRLLSGGFYSLMGNVFPRMFLLISVIIVSNFLGKDVFGEWSLIRPTVDAFMVFATFGLGNTAAKYIAQYKNNDQEQLRKTYLVTSLFSLFLSFLLILIFIFSASWIANSKLDAPYMETYLLAASGMLLFSAINGLQKGVMNGLEAFKELARNNIISISIQSMALIILVYFFGLYGAIAAYTLGYMIFAVLNFKVIRSHLKGGWYTAYIRKLKPKDFKILYSFSLPSALAGVLVLPIVFYSRVLIKESSSFADVGLIDIGEQWLMILFMIPSAIGQVALPLLSSVLGENNEQSKSKYWKLLLMNILIGSGSLLIFALLLTPFSSFILSLYSDGEYTKSSVLILFFFSAVFRSVCTVAGQAILSRGITWLSLVFNIIWASLFLGLLFYLESSLEGAPRYAWAYFISYGIFMIIQVAFLGGLYLRERKQAYAVK